MNENNFNDELDTDPLFDSLRAFAATPVAQDTFGLNNALDMFNRKAKKPFRHILKVSVPLLVVSFGVPSLAYAGVLPDSVSHPIEGFVRTVVTHPALAVAHSLSTIVSPNQPEIKNTSTPKSEDSSSGVSDGTVVAGISGEVQGTDGQSSGNQTSDSGQSSDGKQSSSDNQSSDGNQGVTVNGNVSVGVGISGNQKDNGNDGKSSDQNNGKDNTSSIVNGQASVTSSDSKNKENNGKDHKGSKGDNSTSTALPLPTISGQPSIGTNGGDDSESGNDGASVLPPLSLSGAHSGSSSVPSVQPLIPAGQGDGNEND